MACILEIRKTIQKSIDEKLLLSKNVGIVKRGAEKIRDYLNDLWDSPIAVVKRHKFNGNVYVVEIKSLDAAVNKEFKKQLAAEKSHEKNLPFFNYDSELFIQEQEIYTEPISDIQKIKLQDISFLGKLEGEQVTTEKGAIGVNKQQLMMLLGSTMYNKPLAQVAVKELLQNSFDGIKAMHNLKKKNNEVNPLSLSEYEIKFNTPFSDKMFLEQEKEKYKEELDFDYNAYIDDFYKEKLDLEKNDFNIKPGSIKLGINMKERTISIKDDGIGMTPDIVKNAFLSIGGTNKEGLSAGERSGGLGLAKVQFLMGSESIKVITVKNGTKTTIEATNIQLYNDDFEIQTEQTNENNGTFVEVKIPKDYKTIEGTTRAIDFPGSYGEWRSYDILKKPLIGNVDVNVDFTNSYGISKTESVPIGINSTKETLPPFFSKITFNWGEADVYMSEEKNENPKHQVLSSGIYQFETNFRDPNNYERIKYNIVVNIKPSVISTSEQYPFNNQREGFKNTVENDIKSLNSYLLKYARGESEKEAVDVFSDIKPLPQIDPNKILTPEERTKLYEQVEKTIADNKKAKENSVNDSQVEEVWRNISISSGIITNKQTGETKTEKQYASSFDSDRQIADVAPVNTEFFNPKFPQYHNNTNFDYLKVPGAIEFITDFGNTVLQMVNFAGDELGYRYKKLETNSEQKFFAGVSIDKTYGGVHIRKIINAIFVNPLSFDVSNLEEAVGVALHITIHEINHTTASGEGANFTTDLATLYGKIYATGKYSLYEGLFRSVYKKHFETFNTLKNEYDKSSTKNLSKSFEGNQIKRSSQGDNESNVENVSTGQSSKGGYNGDTKNIETDKLGDVIASQLSKNKKVLNSSSPQTEQELEVKPIEPTPKVDKSNQIELFQIEQQESRLKEKYLVDRVNVLLGDYIKANNIKVEFLDKITSKDGQEVVAKYDSIKRIIQINSNQASALTLPEELAHDLTLALGVDHVLVKRALNLIGRLDYKGILGQQYVDAYKGDVNLLKMELLGKLISKQIADPRLPDELKSEDGVKIWETIKNAIKAFISLFKPNSNITSELDNIVSELSDMIISGKEVGNPTMSVEMFDINSTIHDVKKGFPMTNSNNQKLLSREKTFTLRTKNHPSGLYKFGKNYYNVLNMYGKAVKADEIKNPDYLKKKFVGDEDIRFDHVKAFFDGTEPLYVYQITKVDDSIQAMLEEQAKSGGIPQDVEKYYVFYTRLISKLKKDVKKINNSLSIESKKIEAKIQQTEATLENLIHNNNKQNLIDLAHKTIDDVDNYVNKLYDLEEKGQNFNVKNIEKSIKVLHTFENLEEVGERARLLISRLKRFGIKLLDEEHLRLTGREITDKEKNEIQQDINYGELQFGTLSDVRNYLGKTIGLSIKEKQSIIEKNNKESKKILDIEIKKLEDFQKTQGITGKDIYKIFIQEHRGSTVLTKPYSSDYYKLIADSFEKENGEKIRSKLSVYNSRISDWEPRDSAYYSDNYKEIHKKGNEPLLEFYNFFKKTIADITDKLPVDELDENFIPNIVEATLLSVLKSDKDSVGKLKDGINHIMSANFWSTRENEYFINRELEKNEVPLKYIGNIPSDKKSNDLGYVLLNFMHFGNSYEQMSDVLPKVELFQELMQEKQFIVSKKRNAGSSTNLNSLIDGFIKMQVKGEMKSDNDYFGDKAPIIDFALTYTSLLRIGFSPFAAAANFAVGGTGNMIEAMGGRYFNLANLTEANSIFLAQSFNENSKLSNIISKVNPLMEIDDFLSLEDIQKGANSYTQKLKSGAYFLQRIGEKKLQVSVMIAIMLNNKVTTKNGDKISMWEAFDENGVWDEKLMGYEFLEIDLNKLTNKVQAVNQGIHGRYSSKDAAIFAQQSLFRAVYQFKKWIPAAIESRFGGKKINERLGLETEGRYNSYLKGFKYLWANVKGDIKSIEENKFTELDIYSMRKNLAELLIVTVLLLARAGFEDDKLRKKPAYKFTMSLLNQVSGDLLFFYDPINMQKSFTRIPIERTLKDFSNIFINIPAIFDDGSKSDKKKYHYRSGPNKGENKFTGSFINATPGVKQAFDIYRLGNESPAKK